MKDTEGSSQRPIGIRSKFDWFFILAVIPGVYMVATKLNQIDNKLNQSVTRSAMVKWSVDLKTQYPLAPIFPPEEGVER